jgi:Xaa-Pro aminopeptidase
MLTEEERRWLDAYHARVYAELADRLDEDERVWLAEQAAEI